MKHLIIVCGPTAVGKTEIAIKIAKHFNTEIINADSRQFYREMNIGTAKPSQTELAQVKHHIVNNLSIVDNYSAGKFEQEALQLCEQLFKTKDVLVVAGGSGLFIKALCEGFDEMPKIEENVRKDLNNLLAEKGLEHLQKMLKVKDEVYANKVDLQNPQRVIRALEIILSSGKKFSDLRKNIVKKERNFKCIYIGLERERAKLYDRINLRVDLMLQNGLLKEVKALYKQKHLNALNTVGYKEFFEHFDGKHNLETAIELLKRNSRRFAKRQFTWFRRIEGIKWFHPEKLEELINYLTFAKK